MEKECESFEVEFAELRMYLVKLLHADMSCAVISSAEAFLDFNMLRVIAGLLLCRLCFLVELRRRKKRFFKFWRVANDL